MLTRFLIVPLILALAGCGSMTGAPVEAPSTAPTGGTGAAAGTGGSCHARGAAPYVLPDPACTPGATNPNVTQANIHQTICVQGWTKTVRPSVDYTSQLKREQMRAYGESGPMSAYEEDHLIPLELGGAPSDPHNLWPQPGASPNPKDRVESAAHREVCDGRMQLADAQQKIASDWVAFGRQLGVS